MPRFYAVMLVIAGALAVSACARNHEVAEAAANSPIGIETSQMFITIENKAGTPLLDLSIAIHAIGAPPYTKVISRLDDAEKRDISLADFMSRDGTGFSLRLVTPQSVEVNATDMTGKKYQTSTRWR